MLWIYQVFIPEWKSLWWTRKEISRGSFSETSIIVLIFLPDFWLNPGVIWSHCTSKAHSLHYLLFVKGCGRLGQRRDNMCGAEEPEPLGPGSELAAHKQAPAWQPQTCAHVPGFPVQHSLMKSKRLSAALPWLRKAMSVLPSSGTLCSTLLSLWTACSKPELLGALPNSSFSWKSL